MLTLLAEALRGLPTLQPLTADEYAEAHALFEAASDQRPRIAEWLAARVPGLLHGCGEPALLSVGCGDGSVDEPLAQALADRGRVRYHGLDPDASVLEVFRGRLACVPRVDVDATAAPFDGYRGRAGFDLVLSVHSLYYVADLGAAVRRAVGLLRPGGRLVALIAPREALCELTGLVVPDGVSRWFAGELSRVLDHLGLVAEVDRVDAGLDVSALADPDGEAARGLLDFTAQASTAPWPTAVRDLAISYLCGVARVQGDRLVVDHPVDAFTVRRPRSW